jgi:phage-related holin
LLFYSRINPNKIFQAFVWFTLAINIGAYTSIFFSLLFACKPIAASWDPLLFGTAVCINRGAIYIAQAVIGIATDVMLLGIPIPTVLKLQMPNKQKFGLVGIFSIGSMYV